MATYTVKKGDCLSTIAAEQLGSASRWKEIATLNNISPPKYIIRVGQVLTLPSGASTTTTTANTTNKPTVQFIGLVAGSEREVYAYWQWGKADKTEEYKVIWSYWALGQWWTGQNTSIKVETGSYNNSRYTAPEDATKVQFRVFPVSKTYKPNANSENEVAYYTGDWSTAKEYNFSDNPPITPPTPSVSLKKYILTAELSNLDLNADSIEFQVVKDDVTVVMKGTATINTGNASYAWNVEGGAKYKVRCRSVKDGVYSPEWSDYSENILTSPNSPTGFTVCKAKTETSVYLEWDTVPTAETYTIEYTTKEEYFETSPSNISSTTAETNKCEITGLAGGEVYFFRLNATNETGDSGWSAISSTAIGTTPVAPTTWSSTTTAVVGEQLVLYWNHNCEDGSEQTYADLELTVDGVAATYTIDAKNPSSGLPFAVAFDEDYITGEAVIDTTSYPEGTKLEWRVKTAGVTKTYGECSVKRTVDIYAPPTLTLTVTDKDGNIFDTLTSFPINISAVAGPPAQAPVGYYISIVSTESYESVDNVGNPTNVRAGELIFSRFFDISNASLETTISAGDVDLDNNITYKLVCSVTMNSGLTAEATHDFTVAWTDEMYEPNAEIIIDEANISARIRPYCEDETGALLNGVILSVYRREFDGSFTEIATDIDNVKNTFVTDPHPALDLARYRIVAITKSTGAVSYYDIPGYPIGEKSIIIQWNEAWSDFNYSPEGPTEEPDWSGSMLKLPYNVDVSDSYGPDISIVNYIGRKRPVSYYGTHLGETSSWSTVIPKSDKDTLYALRRLAIWMGDVYVREPSGSGYWANVKVSFSQTHLEMTIPVSFEITRVEGGV